MNWKTEAIDKLKQYEARKNALRSIPQELEALRLARRSIRSATADSTPARGGGSGREDAMLSSIVKEQELLGSLGLARNWTRQVEQGLAVLSREERLVLDRFYINPAKGNVDRLCGELFVEKSQVYARKDAALRKFTIALYGCCET